MGYDTSVDITLMESNISRRIIYFSVMSRTAPGVPVSTMAGSVCSIHKGGAAALASAATLLARDSTNGLYSLTLAQSECSVMGAAGPMCIMVSTASSIPVTAFVNIRAVDSGDSTRFGMVALPNAAAAAAGGLPTFGTGTGQINLSGGSTGIVPAILSGVSVEVKATGIVVASIGKGNYSGVSQEILTGGIQPTSVGAGNYSGMSVEVKSGGIQTVSMGKGNYSGVSQEILTGGIQTTSIGVGTYSGVTFGANPVGDKTGYSVNSIVPGTSTGSVIAAAVWDDPKSLHSKQGSFAYSVVHATDGQATGGTLSSITLASGETTTDNVYANQTISVQYFDGTWQADLISRYTGSSKAAYIYGSWVSIPRSGCTYVIRPQDGVYAYSASTVSGMASTASVVLQPVTHAGATIPAVTNVSNATIAAGTYSTVTVQINNIAPGAYSGVTTQGLSNAATVVTAGTVTDKTGYGIAAGNYSGVSVEVKSGGVQSSSFGAGAVDSVALATSAGQSIADRVLLRNIASGSDTGRPVQDAFRAMRNKVDMSTSVGTVYKENDTTSAYTFSITTGISPIQIVDGGGR